MGIFSRQPAMAGKVVLITGAGSGIGRETAVAFARQKAHIVMVDLTLPGMTETGSLIESAGGSYEAYTCDVSSREAMAELADKVHERHSAVDVLINNAGIGSAGRFLETSLDTWEKVIDVNVLGVVHGCHFFAPQMVAQGKHGSIVNIASAAAFAAAKEMPIYAASKFAVFGFTESLRAEMSDYGIHVATICPGLINTPIVSNTVFEGAMSAGNKAREKAMALYERRNYPPEKVAEAILAAVLKRKSVVPVSPEAWALYYGKRFVPGLMERFGRLDAPVAK